MNRSGSVANIKLSALSKGFRKFLIILAILVAPLILLAAILYPLISKGGTAKYIENYRLPANFTKGNVVEIVKHMHQDSEYQFYFRMLGPKSLRRAVDSAYKILDENRRKERLLEQMNILKNRIQSRALVLNTLNYPSDLNTNPMNYPDIVAKFWDFLDEEFQLTILGLCYKATYDAGFQFAWTDATRQSAQRLESIFYGFTDDQRKQIEESLQVAPL